MLLSAPVETGSSGNVLADKRFAYAQALAAEGDFVAAADLFAQAIEQAPRWAAAYLARGLALEQAGQVEAALASFEDAGRRDADGLLGAELHIARLRGAVPAGMSAAYVATLFDQYAPRFDTHLTTRLEYRGPQIIASALHRAAPEARPAAILDLGCGTGLMARVLAYPQMMVDGIDLSLLMLQEAEGTGLYRHLWRGDCAAVLKDLAAGIYDLVLAADVLVYIGDLQPLFLETARVLASNGFLAATVQAHEGDAYRLGADLRFQHSESYLRACLASAGLTPALVEICSTRTEAGREVPGLVFVARRS